MRIRCYDVNLRWNAIEIGKYDLYLQSLFFKI